MTKWELVRADEQGRFCDKIRSFELCRNEQPSHLTQAVPVNARRPTDHDPTYVPFYTAVVCSYSNHTQPINACAFVAIARRWGPKPRKLSSGGCLRISVIWPAVPSSAANRWGTSNRSSWVGRTSTLFVGRRRSLEVNHQLQGLFVFRYTVLNYIVCCQIYFVQFVLYTLIVGVLVRAIALCLVSGVTK